MINHISVLSINKCENEFLFSEALADMVMDKYKDSNYPRGKFNKIEFIVHTDNGGKITHIEAQFLE